MVGDSENFVPRDPRSSTYLPISVRPLRRMEDSQLLRIDKRGKNVKRGGGHRVWGHPEERDRLVLSSVQLDHWQRSRE